MSYNKQEIKKGVTIHNITTNKFKTNLYAVFLALPLERENVTKNALITAILRRGTQNIQSQNLISQKLEEMYGASFDCGIEKTGDNHVMKFYLEAINEEFIPEKEELTKKCIDILFDIIFNPLVENNGFKREYVESEKNNLKQIIESKIDNKRVYAFERCIEEMFKDEPYGLYKYGYVEDLEKDGLRNWLLNTFSVNNLIHESYPLKQRILFEDIPSGRAFLTPIIEAMREGRIIRFLYQSYWWNEPKMVEAEPYCVKVFKQRWYVVVRNRMHEALRIYALDRIHSLDLTDVTFEYPADFDPQAYFDASFGIIVDEECEIEAVQIKVYNNQSQYLRALPLHHTQKEIAKTDDYSIFEYILRPTYDFKQELLSHGDDIEVLSPAWLREEIKKIAGRMYRRYR